MQSFSPNMLHTYQQCPKKFYFKYIEHINIPISSSFLERGKKIHALANYYLQGTNIDRIKSALNNEEKVIWEHLINNKYYQKECYKSEFLLSCKVGEYWINGRIDAIVKQNREFYILDYKTGSIPKTPEYDYQTMIYLLCVDKYLQQDYDTLSFVYLDLKRNKEKIIEFNTELRGIYEDKIVQIISSITADSSYKQEKSGCISCEYKTLCSKSNIFK